MGVGVRWLQVQAQGRPEDGRPGVSGRYLGSEALGRPDSCSRSISQSVPSSLQSLQHRRESPMGSLGAGEESGGSRV